MTFFLVQFKNDVFSRNDKYLTEMVSPGLRRLQSSESKTEVIKLLFMADVLKFKSKIVKKTRLSYMLLFIRTYTEVH